ncbi:MAG: PAS-domain containing protein, partial [Stellaceae bacterium]
MTGAPDPSAADLIAEGFDACPDGLAVLDAGGALLYANDAYRRVNPLVEPWAASGQAGAREELGMVEVGGDERWYRVTERPLSAGRRMREIADVTEMKRREAEIISMQMRVRESLEALEEGLALFDAADRLVMVNGRYREIFSTIPDLIRPGAPFEELIRVAAERGQNIESLEDPAGWVAERLRCHRAAQGRFEHHFSDGRWILVTERKIADGCTIGTYSDITELKRREELLQATVDNVAEAILVLDSELGIGALNRRALAMFSSESDRAAATQTLRAFVAEHLAVELQRHPAEPLVLEHRTDADKIV